MPTQTFQNLPEEKRERIFCAALEEFSRFSFSQASINRIVKAAGIPRGSFYQYFADKQDVYLLVMEHIGAEKLEIFSQFRSDPGKPLFICVREALPAVFHWEADHPAYGRVALLMVGDGSDFIRGIIDRMGSQKDLLRAMLESDCENGFIREGADLETAAELYLTMSVELLRVLYDGADARERCLKKAEAMLDIIGRGIWKEGVAQRWEKNL